MGFWIAAVAMALGVAALLARAMLSGAARRGEASDLDVYRDQLAGVDRDRARGLIDETEAERLRVEVSRRLLDADRQAQAGAPATAEPRRLTLAAATLAALAVLAGGGALYLRLGAPGYPDLPINTRIALAEEARQNRPHQQIAEAEAALMQSPAEPDPRHAELMERLRQTLAERPDDLEGYILLARNEASLGNYAAAHRAQRRVLEILGTDADAANWEDYALLQVHAAGGYVSPEAEAAVAEALARDPSTGTARYLSGLLYAQTGRPDLAFRIWRQLLQESAPGDPWVPPISDRIGQLARLAGVDYRPPAPRGPDAADVAAAAAMAPDEQQQMIRGMVAGLASRLADTGGPAEDWARLITALGVLGETDRAGAIYAEAREVFASNAADHARIDDAGAPAGVAE
jgi:cytochrome c-type biogenesis protein CcmH